jgi:hypothetical protein
MAACWRCVRSRRASARPGASPRASTIRGRRRRVRHSLVEAPAFRRRLVRDIHGHWPRVDILIGADSHDCAPKVLDFCRTARIDILLGVADACDRRAASYGA